MNQRIKHTESTQSYNIYTWDFKFLYAILDGFKRGVYPCGNQTNEQYFYHGDLPKTFGIGSSSWITNASGNVNQHLAYMPFGESFIDQRASGHDIRFKFTGKERDSKTGFDYFGARYYSSDISVWLSVDPLNILYPNLSPYAYCDNNPVYYIDPDGRTIVPHGSAEFKKQFAKDLEMIKNTDRGGEIVAFLQSPAFTINVTESYWASSGFNLKYDNNTRFVQYDNNNMFNYDYDDVEYVSFVALGHELQHAYDSYTVKGFGSSSTKTKETSAVYFENYLRSVYKNEIASRGIPFALRYTYSNSFGKHLLGINRLELFNSKNKENYFNQDLERINTVTSGQSSKTFTIGDLNIIMHNHGQTYKQKTYDNKKSEKHGTVLYL